MIARLIQINKNRKLSKNPNYQSASPRCNLVSISCWKVRRPIAQPFAVLLVIEGGAGRARKGLHPGHHFRARVPACRKQHERGLCLPAHRHDDHTDAVGPERFGERAAGHQPAANEVAARRLRALIVDRAGPPLEEVAGLAWMHAVAADLAFGPALAAGGALAARPCCRRRRCRFSRHGDDRHDAMAELVLAPAATGAGLVAANLCHASTRIVGHANEYRRG